jgi:hypothetical protein
MIKWQVAYSWGMWYKNAKSGVRSKESVVRTICKVARMEAAELKTAIEKLTARVEKIRDWL